MSDTGVISERTVALPATTPAATTSGDLRAPLYVAWQITNECNFSCLHCIEESGPGKAFKDELNREQTFNVLRQIVGMTFRTCRSRAASRCCTRISWTWSSMCARAARN
jgi:hypothetical protein